MKIVSSVFNSLIAFFAMIFSGRTGRVVTDLLSVATAVVRDLDNNLSLTPEQKRRTAFQRIKAAALAAGLEAADHAINYLIEQEVTKRRGDSLEAILDGGLAVARQVVQEVQARAAGMVTDIGITLDENLFKQAFQELGGRLEAEGKSYLTNPRTINLLIEAAVASFKN